jgi:single-stranded-DNA-specific exonuclease
MEVILTDHHLPLKEIPRPYALINPKVKKEKYPFRDLAGSAVAFKLAQALIFKQLEYLSQEKIALGQEKWLLDLVALGTLADYQPLVSENRVLVKYGLKVLRKTRNLGLKILLREISLADQELEIEQIQRSIIPLINVASRMNHASQAVALLLSSKEEEAYSLTRSLIKANNRRQKISQEKYQEALKQIGKDKLSQNKILIVGGPDWPLGLLGLLASRLLENFHKPVLVWTLNNDIITGSGRAPQGVDLAAALEGLDHLLMKYGGHKQACGFSLPLASWSQFEKKIRLWSQKQIWPAKSILYLDQIIKLSDISRKSLFNKVESLKPFGVGNPYPVWAALNLEVEQGQEVGQNKHYKIWVKDQNNTLWAFIAFNVFSQTNKSNSSDFLLSSLNLSQLKKGDKIDIAFQLEKNNWSGGEEISLKILDINKR